MFTVFSIIILSSDLGWMGSKVWKWWQTVCALDLECHKVKIGMLVDLIFILLAEGNINSFNRMIRKKGMTSNEAHKMDHWEEMWFNVLLDASNRNELKQRSGLLEEYQKNLRGQQPGAVCGIFLPGRSWKLAHYQQAPVFFVCLQKSQRLRKRWVAQPGAGLQR